MRRGTRALFTAGVAVAGLALPSPPAWALPGFGTRPVTAPPTGAAQTVVTSLDVAHDAGFDRLVFTFSGPLPGYSVAYVPQVRRDASGEPLHLRGAVFASVVLRSTSTATPAPQGDRSPELPMVREVAGAGDFEGVTSYGVGLTGRSGLRAFTLPAPNRLVVDFATRPGTAPARTGARAASDASTPLPPAGATHAAPSGPASRSLPDTGPRFGATQVGLWGGGAAAIGVGLCLLAGSRRPRRRHPA